jgi:hypothetical protein
MKDSSGAFGVGCFHVGLREASARVTSGAQYIEAIRRILETAPNVSAVEIDADEEFLAEEFDTIEPSPLETGPGYFPSPAFLVMSYDIYLPNRVQEELTGRSEEILGIFSDRLRVTTSYPAYGLPVTFVQVVDPSSRPTASSAVFVVRRFLEKLFSDGTNHGLKFESLGPSPFHANFSIECADRVPSGNTVAEFECEVCRSRGYDGISFKYRSGQFPTVQDACQRLWDLLEDELGVYYFVEQCRARMLTDWCQMGDMVRKMTDVQQRWGFFSPVVRGKAIREVVGRVMSAAVEFEIESLEFSAVISDDRRKLEDSEEPFFLHVYLDQAVKEVPNYPVEGIISLANFVEGRLTRGVEAAVVLTAAVIGGVLGAVVAMLFSS